MGVIYMCTIHFFLFFFTSFSSFTHADSYGSSCHTHLYNIYAFCMQYITRERVWDASWPWGYQPDAADLMHLIDWSPAIVTTCLERIISRKKGMNREVILLPINICKVIQPVHHCTVRKLIQMWKWLNTVVSLARSVHSSRFIPRSDCVMPRETAKNPKSYISGSTSLT